MIIKGNQPAIGPILENIRSIVAENLTIDYQLYLIGSRANGREQEKSDIDIAIIPKQQMNAFELGNIREELEKLPTLLKIDFIDLSAVAAVFKKIALKNALELK